MGVVLLLCVHVHDGHDRFKALWVEGEGLVESLAVGWRGCERGVPSLRRRPCPAQPRGAHTFRAFSKLAALLPWVKWMRPTSVCVRAMPGMRATASLAVASASRGLSTER